jgi:hypothetical protein
MNSYCGENMNSLFDTKSEALMLKTLGEENVFAVLQRDFSGSTPQNEKELSIVSRFAKKIRGSIRASRTSPLTVSELAKRSDIAINARLP